MTRQLLLFCWLWSSWTISTTAFLSPLSNLPFAPTTAKTPSVRAAGDTALCMAVKSKKKNKKPSMAERRKRRQQKSLGGPNPYADLPSPKLDFSSGVEEPKEESIHVPNPEAAAEKAKELLKAQRDSVNMLTMVKERILERLTDAEFRTNLETNGYAVVDGFLGGGGDDESSSILDQLLEEGNVMLAEGGMEVDTANLGKGQYIVPIAGGEKQYASCPRMVEIVVSATKNIPEAFGENDSEGGSAILELDDSACMVTLRSFDRKALKASLVLLKGNEDDSTLDADMEAAPLAVIANRENDQRKLSLHYFIVPSSWTGDCGGGLEFKGGARVDARQDRLVVLYSDTTQCKALPWKGSDDSPELAIGNSIELHLIGKRQ